MSSDWLTPDDLRWLGAAVRIASPHLGTTAENPTVGALVVESKRQVLLGRGVTAPGGRPHAEPQALSQAGESARGAVLYVTLEPCAHWGRTPPCVDAVLAAGVERVVIGQLDPDPRTAGRSVARLQAARVNVVVADHQPSRILHEGFFARVLNKRPYVTAKLAVSSDGMIGLAGVGNVAITGEAARRWTHMQRALSDAVMIGANTAQLDDPQLTVRLKGLVHRTPLRAVLAGRGQLRRDLRLFAGEGPVVVVGVPGAEPPEGVEFWSGLTGVYPDVYPVLQVLASHGIGRLLVEGGANLTGRLLDGGLVDRFELLTSKIVIGPDGVAASDGVPLEQRMAGAGLVEVDRRALGDDMLRTFERA